MSTKSMVRKIGETQAVLVDAVGEEVAITHSSADAPEADGLIYIENGPEFDEGDFPRPASPVRMYTT